MKRFFTASANPFDAPDLLNTTIAAKGKDKIAFDLGMGDTADLLSAGLQPKSNAALKALTDILGNKKKNDDLADVVRQRILDALRAINEELDWLDDQIRVETEAIALNTQTIDFIQGLDESNVIGEDGQVRDDVRALLEEHGYNDLDGKDAGEVMIMLREIEIDLHEDNRVRQERIHDYEHRHGILRRRAGDIAEQYGSTISAADRQRFAKMAQREPPETNARSAMIALSGDQETTSEVVQDVELQQSSVAVSQDFSL